MSKKRRPHVTASPSIQAKAFMQRLYRNTRDAKSTFGWLKLNGTEALIEEIAKMCPQAFRFHLFGRLSPKKYDKLFKNSRNFAGSMELELRWVIMELVNNSSQLRAFSDARRRFDRYLLLGDYSNSREVLSDIETEFGVSCWLLANQFLVSELEEGLDANTRRLSEFNAIPDLHVFTSILASFLSLRAEKRLSHENFQRKLSRYLEHFDSRSYLKYFFGSRLGALDITGDEGHFATSMFFSGNASLVDRAFEVMRYLVTTLAIGDHDIAVTESQLIALYRAFPQPELTNIMLLVSEGVKVTTGQVDIEMIEVLDAYTSGNYERTVSLAVKLLIEEPSIFQLYELYTKSLIFSNRQFVSPLPPGSPADEILKAVNGIYRKSSAYAQKIEYLARAAEMFHYLPLAAGCRSMASSDANDHRKNFADREFIISSQFINPRLSYLARTHERSLQVGAKMQTLFSKSLTVSFVNSILGYSGGVAEIDFPAEVDSSRKAFYKASLLVNRGNFSTAVPLLEKLYEGRLEVRRNDYPLYDEITVALYGAYIRSEQVNKALKLYVENLLREPIVTRGLDTQSLRAQLEQNQNSESQRDIDRPIFYSAITTNPQVMYVAYDNFLSAHGYTRPRDFIKDASYFATDRVACFLHKVCNQKVMAGSFHFTGTDDLESERMLICQFLCKIDPPNASIYTKEIDEITQRVFIKRGIQKVEEGKIYVDALGIRKAGDRLMGESFRRYKALAASSSSGELRLLDTSSVAGIARGTKREASPTVNLKELEAEGIRVVFTSHFALFKELFLEVRDRFISSSEFGLDSYLSVRIRHGTLEGQIRSRFEALHLVTQRNTLTDEYQRNAFWDSTLNDCDAGEKEKIQCLLAQLSREIDEMTRNVKDVIVQIRTETKNPEGLLDFRFEDGILLKMFIDEFEQFGTYDEFIDGTFRALWRRLDASLQTVRTFMMDTLKDRFVQRLTELQAEVRKFLKPGRASNLFGSISNCMTAIQNECDRIGRWFTMTGAKYETDVKLRQIIDVCVASVNNVNPEIPFAPKVVVTGDREVSGEFFLSFFDIFRTLLDNAVRHAGDTTSDVFIGMVIDDRMATLTIQNKISDAVRQADPVGLLKDRIEQIKSRGVSEDIKREGGTGYAKILKILQSDLGRRNVEIDFDYTDTEQFQVQIGFETDGLIP